MSIYIGQLYVKLIEGRNIPAVDGKSSDPIVTLSLRGEASKIKLESKPIERNLNPIWNEEFVFTLTKRDVILKVNVKDHNKIFKNKPIGVGEVEIAKCPDNQVVEVWCPLKNYPNAQIHLLCRYTPLSICTNKPINLRMPSFRLQLERPYYWSGEIIRGHVLFNVGKPKKIRGVRLRFDGYSITDWYDTETYYSTYHSSYQSRTVRYYAKLTFFNPIATLYGAPRGSSKEFYIQSGSYLWPFEFGLPVGLPPTFNGEFGKNYYCVTAYVDIPWAVDKKAKQEFKICVEYKADSDMEHTIRASEKTTGSIFADSGSITIIASSKDIAHIGEFYDLGITVINGTDRAISQLKFKLQNQITYCGERWSAWGRNNNFGFTCRKETKNVVFNTAVNMAIEPHGQWSGNVQLQIPHNIPPTITSSLSPLIYVYYTLYVEAVTKGNIFTRSKSEIDFKIKVGQRKPPELMHIIPPSAPLGTPCLINVIKVEQITQQYWNALAPPPVTTELPKGSAVLYGGTLPAEMYKQNIFQPEQWYEQGENEQNLMHRYMPPPGTNAAAAAAPPPIANPNTTATPTAAHYTTAPPSAPNYTTAPPNTAPYGNAYGAPPNAYGAPSNANPYGVPPHANSYSTLPRANSYSAPPNANPYGAPPNANSYGAIPRSHSYSAPLNANSYAAPPNTNSYAAPPNANPYGAPPNTNPYGAPPNTNSYGAPPSTNPYAAPPPRGQPYPSRPAPGM